MVIGNFHGKFIITKEILAILPYSEWSDLQRKMRVPEYDYSKNQSLLIMSPRRLLNLQERKRNLNIYQRTYKKSLKKAQEAAQNDKEDFRNVITEQKFLFEKDRNLSLKWSTIISLCVFIVGRY